MEYSAELARLEEFVDKLLNKYNTIKSECHALQETLRQRDNECADLKNKVFELSAERTEVGGKVSGLLDRIEQWENDQAHSTDSGNEGHRDGQEPRLRSDDELKTY
ncbi:MAG: cell division protein ZapB [Desulfobulbus sp.]|nr:cell division protein ZapB [Desulfobulbus sp.]